jgi:formate hydrogenlyase subunit 3/multisubunit Na+/H+ antiporter MnhD subunit
MTWVLLALVTLAVGAAVSLLVSSSKRAGLGLGLAALVVASLFCMLGGADVLRQSGVVAASAEWPMPLGSARLAIDGVSAWFLVIIGAVSFAAAIYSWGYFGGGEGHGSNRAYAPLLCALAAAMMLVVCAADVIVFLFGWELMSLTAFFLVGLNDDSRETRQGAWMYLIATHLGTALGVLPVFGAFVARSGATQMSGFAGAFAPSETGTCIVLFTLGVVGFGTKAGFMPLHVWLPAAHPVAPSPVSALMSGVVIKMGIYGLLRLVSWLPELPAACGLGLASLSIITAVMGILYALGQRQVKRMPAYSSVENIGIIGLSIAVAILGRSLHQPVLVTLGLGGALLHVLNHSLFKGLLFLSAGAVLHGTGTGDMGRLGGLSRMMRANSVAFLIGSTAICALPPLNGFISEYVVYLGLLNGLQSLPIPYAVFLASCAALLALTGAIALAAFAKVFSIVFLGEPRDRSVTTHAMPRSMTAGTLLLAFACIAVATGASALTQPLSAALKSITIGASIPARQIQLPLELAAPLAPPLLLLFAMGLGLFGLRNQMPRGTVAGGTGNTWGCGYAFPAPSMQYTSSSFAWKLIHSFSQVVRPKRNMPAIGINFPGRHWLETETRDFALERVFQPGFRALSWAFERLWPLQHGRVQLYLVYIVVTALVVFLVEAWQSPFVSTTREYSVQPAVSLSPSFIQTGSGGRSDADP